MKKLILGLCAVLALSACKDEKKDTAQADTRPVIKIGATLPLSGDLSYVGIGAQNALQMLLEKWQNQNTKYKYELLFENDMVKPQQAAINTQKFINMDKARVVVSVFGIVDRPVDEIANQNKIISLSCSHGKRNIPEYGLNTGMQNEENYAEALRQLKKRNVKTVALVGSHAAVSNVILDYMAEHLPQDNIQVLANERYAIGETDYRLSIQKIEDMKPDYYLVFGVEPMNSIFVKQYNELTGKNNIAGLGTFCNIDSKVFPAIEGVWSTDFVGNNETFVKEYSNKYHTRVEVCSANLYDGLDMIITAFENTPVEGNATIPDNFAVMKNIKEQKVWNGASGKIKIEENGIVRSEVKSRIYKNGQWVKTEE